MIPPGADRHTEAVHSNSRAKDAMALCVRYPRCQPRPAPRDFAFAASGALTSIAVCFSPARSWMVRISRALSSVTTIASDFARESAT